MEPPEFGGPRLLRIDEAVEVTPVVRGRVVRGAPREGARGQGTLAYERTLHVRELGRGLER
ncbi:MAG: hypothetical protein A2V77_09755 [Anaeromyxobacter sp. RBG_16_69_14]|nr:MAG: hypothetical protein A2V77_09755 [Anaeromyxobacter sp. RBG_16_69_14]